jgi:hypothetical protein
VFRFPHVYSGFNFKVSQHTYYKQVYYIIKEINMGFSLFGNGDFGSGLFGMGLLGSDDKSYTEDIKYPDYYSDPNFDSTQTFLNDYSKNLLQNGPVDYYKPLGEYGSPEFMDFMNQSNAATLKGIDEAGARTGRARGGRTGEIAAQALGDKNATLMYSDYLRAMNGRQTLMNTGLNTQFNVRDAGFNNQNSRNNFNVGGAEFNYRKALGLDAYDQQGNEAMGKMIGNLAPIAGAGIGMMVGGPVGALAGYGIGSSLFGGSGETPQWLDVLNQSKGTNVQTPASTAGVSTLGAINPADFRKNYSPKFGNYMPEELDFAALGL